jgi:N-formylglutamate deformylase
MIVDPFTLTQGDSPLLISMPHVGTKITQAVADGLVPLAMAMPDTDWHLPRLYDFAIHSGATVLAANYSRYIIDLNRPEDDQPLYVGATTGLFPTTLFNGNALFQEGKTPSVTERQSYIEMIWRPYHQQISTELARLKSKYGYAILFDAHSIRGEIPFLFEGRLPDLNLGTFNGESCDQQLAQSLAKLCEASAYTSVLNGRFKGGYITRHYGQPQTYIHAVQLEMAQAVYMEEAPPFRYDEEKATKLKTLLEQLLETMTLFHK